MFVLQIISQNLKIKGTVSILQPLSMDPYWLLIGNSTCDFVLRLFEDDFRHEHSLMIDLQTEISIFPE